MKALTQALVTVATGLAIFSALAAGAPTDFDGDGKSDILWRNAATGQNYAYLMNGRLIAGEGYLRTVADAAWQVVGLGDFDGDGKADILWRNFATGENYIYLMQGTTVLGEGAIRTVDLEWRVVGVGDFDGDGKADILWRNTATGENHVHLMQGITIYAEGYLRTLEPAWRVAGVGDFNGDGNADILWRNVSTGENYLFPMYGMAILATEGYIRTVADTNWQVKAVADFNGDGKADILWRNVSTGENYLYPMNGRTILSGEGYVRTVSDQAWQIVAAGDYDGDGKADILWRNTSTGENYFYPMDGTTIKATEGYIRTVTDLTWWPADAPNGAILSWDAVTHPNLAGYRVYYGTAPAVYFQLLGQGVNVGNVTTYALTGLRSGVRYYFAVTAVDTSNNESAFSNEVFKDFRDALGIVGPLGF